MSRDQPIEPTKPTTLQGAPRPGLAATTVQSKESYAFIAIDCALTNCDQIKHDDFSMTPLDKRVTRTFPCLSYPFFISVTTQNTSQTDNVEPAGTVELAAGAKTLAADKSPDLDIIFEMQNALTSEMTPRQESNNALFTATYRDLCRQLKLDPDEVCRGSSMFPFFAFQKDIMREFMTKQELNAYSPHYLGLKDTATGEEKEQLRVFFKNCIASKTTSIVIKGVNGTRGENNFFVKFDSKNNDEFEGFYTELMSAIMEITKKKFCSKSGIFTKLYKLERKDLLIEQCRNNSLESDQAATYRLVLALKLNVDGQITNPETDVKFLVSNMDLHAGYNSHKHRTNEICFFDDRVWAVKDGQYVGVSSLTNKMRVLKQSINESPALRKTMVRFAQTIAIQCKTDEIKPSLPQVVHVPVFFDMVSGKSDDPFQYLRKPPYDNAFLAICPKTLMCVTDQDLLGSISKTSEFAEIRLNELLRETGEQLRKLAGDLDSLEIKNPLHLEQCIDFIRYRYVYFVDVFLDVISIDHLDLLNNLFSNKNLSVVKQAFLLLLLGPENAEQIKDKMVLYNAFTIDDFNNLKKLSAEIIEEQKETAAIAAAAV